MPTRLLLEGPDIETLLAQVRDEYGSAARIVSADKVRTGGLGGFFSKERYELAVEIDAEDAPADAAAPAPGSIAAPAPGNLAGPTSVERATAAINSVQALLELADANESKLSSAVTAKAAAGPASLARHPAAAQPGGAEAALGALARQGAPAKAVSAEPMLPSTAGNDFAHVLAGLRENIGAAPPAPPAPAVRPFRPSTGIGEPLTTEARGVPVPPTVSELTVSPAAAAMRAGAEAELADAVLAESLRAEAARMAESAARTAPHAYSVADHVPPPAATSLDAAATAAGFEPAAPMAPSPLGAAAGSAVPQAVPPAAAAVTTPEDTTSAGAADAVPLARELASLGVPEGVARRALGRDPYSAIVRAFGVLPAPTAPPTGPGEILVIAGELTGALGVAHLAARRMRVDAANILVVGPTVAGTGVHSSRRMSGPADAQKRAAKLQSADAPHIVVVDAPIDGDNGRWVQSVVDALGATAVWALVDATRKTADVARQLSGFGMVDAIAVHSTGATADPASVLSLGIPVALLDGRRATPQAWAALLCDLLVEPEPEPEPED